MSALRAYAAFASLAVCVYGCESDKSESIKASSAISRPQQVVANNYSGGNWTKGVRRKDRRSNMFYYLADKDQPILRVGDTLVFAKSGRAKVTKVDTKEEKSKVSVFVTVDKELDPEGDGFPKRIAVE